MIIHSEITYPHHKTHSVIEFARKLKPRDFKLKKDSIGNRKSKRAFLKDKKNREFMKRLNKYFQTYLDVPRIRIGKRQELETLINEEALVFASYLRNRRKTWKPRIPSLEEVLS